MRCNGLKVNDKFVPTFGDGKRSYVKFAVDADTRGAAIDQSESDMKACYEAFNAKAKELGYSMVRGRPNPEMIVVSRMQAQAEAADEAEGEVQAVEAAQQ